MKIIATTVIIFVLYMTVFAQSVVMSNVPEKVQSVSGDFAKAWIKNYLATNPKPVHQINDTNLWSWGAIPKGKKLVEGKLEDNITYFQNMTANWLGDYYLNPYTSEPINPAYYPGYVNPVYSPSPYLNQYNLPYPPLTYQYY